MDQVEVDSVTRLRVWTPELEKLLRRWKMQIGKRERGHRILARTYRSRHYLLGGPLILVTATAAIISAVGSVYGAVPLWASITSASLSGVATGLSSLQTLLNYAESADGHKRAADDCASLYREIELMQDVPGPLRGDPVTTLRDLRNRYDEIVKNSPSLPEKHSPLLSYDTVSDRRSSTNPSSVVRAPSPNDIHIDMNREPIDEEGLNALRKILQEDSEGKSLECIVNEENDYNTDDEDREVCIPFDLDGAGPSYSTMASAVAAAQLASKREARAQRSLQTALRYEIQRLENQRCTKTPSGSGETTTPHPNGSSDEDGSMRI